MFCSALTGTPTCQAAEGTCVPLSKLCKEAKDLHDLYCKGGRACQTLKASLRNTRSYCKQGKMLMEPKKCFLTHRHRARKFWRVSIPALGGVGGKTTHAKCPSNLGRRRRQFSAFFILSHQKVVYKEVLLRQLMMCLTFKCLSLDQSQHAAQPLLSSHHSRQTR